MTTRAGAAHNRHGVGASVRPRRALATVSGWAALLTGVVAVGLGVDLSMAGPSWYPWYLLPWLACGLPAAAAGVFCLARRPAASAGSAAVFASCAAAAAWALLVLQGSLQGLFLAGALILLLCVAVAVLISVTVSAVMIGLAGARSRRRAAVWAAAGLVLAAVSVPSPVYVPGSAIQTTFAGMTAGEDALGACSLLLLVLPLVMIGLAPGRMAAVMVLAWLPGAAAPLLGWYVPRPIGFHFDTWYYVGWLVWLAIAVLAALAQGRRLRDGKQSEAREAH